MDEYARDMYKLREENARLKNTVDVLEAIKFPGFATFFFGNMTLMLTLMLVVRFIGIPSGGATGVLFILLVNAAAALLSNLIQRSIRESIRESLEK